MAEDESREVESPNARRAHYLEVFLTQHTQFCKNVFCKRIIHSWLTLRNTHSGQCWNKLVGMYSGTEKYSQEASSFHPEDQGSNGIDYNCLPEESWSKCRVQADGCMRTFLIQEKIVQGLLRCSLLCLITASVFKLESQRYYFQKNVKQIYFSVVYQVNLILSTDIFSQFSISGSSNSKAFSCPSLTAMHMCLVAGLNSLSFLQCESVFHPAIVFRDGE